jgi:hypothetical protein
MKEFLLDALHEARGISPSEEFAKGYVTGMSFVMICIGIDEAASPERLGMSPFKVIAVRPSEDEGRPKGR